jgi:hypothetical protein
MKNLLIGILLMGVIACSQKPKVEEQPKDDFLSVPTYSEPTKPEVKTYTPIYQQASSTSTPTYWYITFEEVKRNEKGEWDGTIDWHRAIQLSTPYFDFVEAKKALPVEVTGECYFDFIIQINKESYESYQIYRRDYFK